MNEIDKELILQAIEPEMTIPEDMKSSTLFLLNLNLIVDQDVWDDYGNKELAQALRLRAFADRIIAIAEKLDQLGAEFKCFPDANDYDEKSAKSAKLYDKAIEAANIGVMRALSRNLGRYLYTSRLKSSLGDFPFTKIMPVASEAIFIRLTERLLLWVNDFQTKTATCLKMPRRFIFQT